MRIRFTEELADNARGPIAHEEEAGEEPGPSLAARKSRSWDARSSRVAAAARACSKSSGSPCCAAARPNSVTASRLSTVSTNLRCIATSLRLCFRMNTIDH